MEIKKKKSIFNKIYVFQKLKLTSYESEAKI